jgi:D-threo-aldose 1-dehydrogenase
MAGTFDSSRFGLGASPLGGLFAEIDEATASATVDRAWELGVRHFDTAPLYGSGLSEQRLGAALRDRPRDEYLLSTKVGRLLRPGEPDPVFKGAPALAPVFDYSADGVLRSIDESLARLGVDRIDLALVHDPEEHLDEGLAALEPLRSAVPLVGVGTNVPETAVRFVVEGGVDYVLLAGRYTLLDRSAEAEFLPLAERHGVRVIAAGVYNSGILAGGTTFEYRPAEPEVLARVRHLEAACARYGVPLVAAAIQFPLRHPAVTRIVVGARSPAEVAANVSLLELSIPDELWDDEAFATV